MPSPSCRHRDIGEASACRGCRHQSTKKQKSECWIDARLARVLVRKIVTRTLLPFGGASSAGRSSHFPAFLTRRTEQCQRGPRHPLKQRAVGSRARKNTDAEEHPKQEACRIIRIDAEWRRSIALRGEDTPFEKCFDLGELFGNHGAELALMRCDFQRRIDKETTFALSILDRVIDYLGKEPMNGLLGRQRRLQPPWPVARAAIEIPFQSAGKKVCLSPNALYKLGADIPIDTARSRIDVAS